MRLTLRKFKLYKKLHVTPLLIIIAVFSFLFCGCNLSSVHRNVFGCFMFCSSVVFFE